MRVAKYILKEQHLYYNVSPQRRISRHIWSAYKTVNRFSTMKEADTAMKKAVKSAEYGALSQHSIWFRGVIIKCRRQND